MAALVLSVAGGAAGAAFGPVGAIAGRLAGALIGNIIDHRLFGPGNQTAEGPRLADLDVMASTEGAPIPRVYGRARLAGQVIWATDLEEVVANSTAPSSGGKGGALSGPTTTTTTYTYFANFAVGLCEGLIGRVGRIWADGKPLDLTGLAGSRPYRPRGSTAGRSDRRARGRGQRPGLSRPGLCRVRAAAAGGLRQPDSATHLRDHPPGRRAGGDDPRGDADPRHHRIRL